MNWLPDPAGDDLGRDTGEIADQADRDHDDHLDHEAHVCPANELRSRINHLAGPRVPSEDFLPGCVTGAPDRQAGMTLRRVERTGRNDFVDCPYCDGSGEINERHPSGDPALETGGPCAACGGSGGVPATLNKTTATAVGHDGRHDHQEEPLMDEDGTVPLHAADFLPRPTCPDCGIRPAEVRLLAGGQAAVCLPCAQLALEQDAA